MISLKRAYLSIILLFLYAPIATLIIFSFNAHRSRGAWGGFSLDWYRQLFSNPAIVQALNNTLMIALISAFVSTVIGTIAALGVVAMKKNTRRVILNLNSIPVLNPEIVTGISLRIFFLFVINAFGGRGSLGFTTLILAHITFNICYVMLSVLPKVRALDSSIYEAARDLGATPFSAFWKVIMPQLWPGVVTGFILAFTLSLDDFIISFFTTGAGVNTLSIYIYTSTRLGVSPEVNALSTLMFVALMLLLFIVHRRDQRELRKNKRIKERV